MKLKYLALFVFIGALMGTPLPDAEVFIEAGTTYNGNITTLTGDITVNSGARVNGILTSTSGDIYIEDGARVKKIIAVNGDVFLDVGVTVDQSLTVTYGSLRAKSNCTLNGDVLTESGDIRISGSYLKKSIKTRHGDIILKDNTYVKKDIIILDRGNSNDLEPLEIYLGAGVEINGDVEAEDDDQLVELVLFDAEVNGNIENITVAEDEEDDNDDCGDRPTWTSSEKYKKNDQVQHEGEVYKAKKNTKNYNPTKSGKKNPWNHLGSCDSIEDEDDDDDDDDDD